NTFATLGLASHTVCIAGVSSELLIFHHLRGRALNAFIVSLGLLWVMQAGAQLAFGVLDKPVPSAFSGVVRVFGLVMSVERVVVTLSAIVLIAALYLFLRWSRPGRAMRAVAQDPDAAALQGVNIDAASALGFGVGCALAGGAGGLLAPLFPASPAMGALIALTAAAMPLITRDSYYLDVATTILMNLTLTMSFRLQISTGQINMAHISFMGIGAYASALLVTRAGLSFWATLWIGALVAASLAVPIGSIALRVSGPYYFLITFAFSEVVRLFFNNFFEGLACVFFAHFRQVLHSSDFGLEPMVLLVVFTVIGGTGSVWGPAVGTILMTIASELLRELHHYEILVFGAVLILTMLFAPEGLVALPGAARRLVRKVRGRASEPAGVGLAP